MELDEKLQTCTLNTHIALGALSTQNQYMPGSDKLHHGHAPCMFLSHVLRANSAGGLAYGAPWSSCARGQLFVGD